jgi:hypothetical protein
MFKKYGVAENFIILNNLSPIFEILRIKKVTIK